MGAARKYLTDAFKLAPESGLTLDIRVVDINGNPWFVAMDVCRVLDLNQPHVAYRRLAADEITYRSRTTVGMPAGREMAFLSESGLYKLILRSDKPDARKFQDWVTREVLPAIRKDGAYVMGEEKVRRIRTPTDNRNREAPDNRA